MINYPSEEFPGCLASRLSVFGGPSKSPDFIKNKSRDVLQPQLPIIIQQPSATMVRRERRNVPAAFPGILAFAEESKCC